MEAMQPMAKAVLTRMIMIAPMMLILRKGNQKFLKSRILVNQQRLMPDLMLKLKQLQVDKKRSIRARALKFQCLKLVKNQESSLELKEVVRKRKEIEGIGRRRKTP